MGRIEDFNIKNTHSSRRKRRRNVTTNHHFIARTLFNRFLNTRFILVKINHFNKQEKSNNTKGKKQHDT